MRLVYNISYCLWFSSYLKINQNDFVCYGCLFDSVRNLIKRGVSYNRMASYYQSLHPYATWISSRSVKKFGERYDNFIVITTVVRWEIHSYNRTLTSRLSKVYFTGLQGCSTNETWSKSLWFTGKGKSCSVFCTLLWF